MKDVMFAAFILVSVVCFLAEVIEIVFGISLEWSDHLHNLIDHIAIIIINVIGYKLLKSQ